MLWTGPAERFNQKCTTQVSKNAKSESFVLFVCFVLDSRTDAIRLRNQLPRRFANSRAT